ncbi:Glycosylphosphatidylinositol (GPI) anchor assembly protein [Purpureocillium takamizusanense]|uniref:Glycosylphosphatidylinositol (GPI) anchor assembly protein n=1 Tax=Purpureocillium takamizusanense TaxID=2060973 RepID=A0A9Q8VCM4_9HYPO|nr:Glycosylphosphatidylinositol (GPI) anchor assembly protein [Purpureocillium takamizusanense]UNI20838.1 Glycosylphosphatidylinositol (GPI) anchor assembly protein [Purpureocillium takamizusanense]
MPLVDPVTMSRTLARGSSAPSPQKAAAISPVAILDAPLAGPLALARPAALLALLAVRFGALVADPVPTLRSALPVVAVVQAVYAVLCLPVAGSQHGRAAKKQRPGEKRKPGDGTGPNPISSAVLSLILAVIATPAVHLLFVLFGAPFLDHVPHTLLCAAHFSMLVLFPTFYARGVDTQALVAVAGAAAPLDETFGALLGAVLGAWLGAVPIPLDWDRDWQRWPVTIVVGMYAGATFGAWAAGTVLYGKRLVSEAEESTAAAAATPSSTKEE